MLCMRRQVGPRVEFGAQVAGIKRSRGLNIDCESTLETKRLRLGLSDFQLRNLRLGCGEREGERERECMCACIVFLELG